MLPDTGPVAVLGQVMGDAELGRRGAFESVFFDAYCHGEGAAQDAVILRPFRFFGIPGGWSRWLGLLQMKSLHESPSTNATFPRRVRNHARSQQFRRRFLRDDDGPTAVEYAVMLAPTIVVCIVAITTLGQNAVGEFAYVGSQLTAS
jgi:pilus assembly protein Flp/PilA